MFEYKSYRQAIDQAFARDLFFIGGTIKSGTTWLQKMMDAHPEVACRGEGHIADFLGADLYKVLGRYNKKINGKNKTIFKEIDGFPLFKSDHLRFLLASALGLLLADYDVDDGVKVIGEKTPDNVVNLGLLWNIFPKAKFVHIIRDGRDVAVSGWFHNQRISSEWASKKFGSLEGFARHYAPRWVDQVSKGRAQGKKNPDNYMEIRYEDLHQNPAGEAARLLRFLGVKAGDGVVAACCEAGSFKTLSGGRDPGEEDKGSHFRKGIVGDWRNHLDVDTVAEFDRHAGGLLRELGYQ